MISLSFIFFMVMNRIIKTLAVNIPFISFILEVNAKLINQL